MHRARLARHAAALALAGGATAAAACQAPMLSLATGMERSQWQEFAADGSRLLRERGSLPLVGVQLDMDCGGLEWSAQWLHSQGERAYDGHTNVGTVFQTESRLRHERLQVQAWLPLQPAWAVGVQLRQQWIAREIIGRDAVLGYPEHDRYWQAALGLRYRQPLGQRLRWQTALWVGAGPGGRMRLDLPGHDPATLDLGRSRFWAWDLGLQGGAPPGESGWTWHTAVGYRSERTAAGPDTLLTRGGRPAGVAHQPRFTQQQWQLSAGIGYRF